MRLCDAESAFADPLFQEAAQDGDSDYAGRLVKTVYVNRERLDDLIREKVKKWEFHRVAILDRIILRIAIAEMLYFGDVPAKVSINEAIEIGKAYSTGKSGKFINGILDAVLSDINRGRIIPASGN